MVEEHLPSTPKIQSSALGEWCDILGEMQRPDLGRGTVLLSELGLIAETQMLSQPDSLT